MKFKKYILNCFLLLVPIFLWNAFLSKYLPKGYNHELFDRDIPVFIEYSEIILRVIVFIIPLIMIISFKTKVQKAGFIIYLLGIIIYFSSWLVVIKYPESIWSKSLIGFMAPAYTTIIWFVGIGLIGSKTFFKIAYVSVIYIIISILFVIMHSLHAYTVYQNL